MTRKAPRRTAQRIQETALTLFNRFGEPNVSTTLLATELRISPGNLYYHFPAKEALINRLHEDFEAALDAVLGQAAGVRDLPGAWRFVRELFELMARYRFLYRDMNDLLSNNHHLETRLREALARKEAAMAAMLSGLGAAGLLRLEASERDILARSMVVLATYWLNYEFVCNPRQALEPEAVREAIVRGTRHTLQVLAPYLGPAHHGALQQLQQRAQVAEPVVEDALPT